MNESFVSAFLLLLLVCDPVGNIPIFVSALEDVPRYAEELSEYIKSRHPEILNGIRESKDIGAHLEPKLVAALDAFAKVGKDLGII